MLPTKGVLVDWRAGEIERVHGGGDDQNAQDIRWLVFELRHARSALTKILALAEELGDQPAETTEGSKASDDGPTGQMRFIANEALGLYPIAAEGPAARSKTPR